MRQLENQTYIKQRSREIYENISGRIEGNKKMKEKKGMREKEFETRVACNHRYTMGSFKIQKKR